MHTRQIKFILQSSNKIPQVKDISIHGTSSPWLSTKSSISICKSNICVIKKLKFNLLRFKYQTAGKQKVCNKV